MASDVMWDFALPEGVGRDHKFCNPMVVDEVDDACFDRIKQLGWKILLTGCDGDPLIDRRVEFVEMLRRKGNEIMSYFGEGVHGMERLEPRGDEPQFEQIKYK
jgi:hypothetical protein